MNFSRTSIIILCAFISSLTCGWITGPDDEFMSGNIVAYISSEDWSLYYMNIDTGEKKKITDEVYTALRWSRDGSMIAYTGPNFFNGLPTNDLPEAVYIANADGSGKQIVTLWERKGIIEPHLDGGNNPVWSPDNSRIAFSKCINCEMGGSNSEIYIIDRERCITIYN